MSDINVEVLHLGQVRPHPNADRLDIAEVLGTQCVVAKGQYKYGDKVCWIPPNMLIPTEVADRLGVTNYLKSAIYPGFPGTEDRPGRPADLVASKCRVAAARLRGEVSYGIITQAKLDASPGDSVNCLFDAVKYEPPAWTIRGQNPDAAPEHPAFHKYSNIQNFYKYPDLIAEGTKVKITEKIHGTNARYGLIRVGDEWQFMAGSHNVNIKGNVSDDKISRWWAHLNTEILELLTDVCDEKREVILFGEIFGPGIQDMDYGLTETGFRAFDLSINGKYVDHPIFEFFCQKFKVPMVPLLYLGEFNKAKLEELTHGPTTFEGVKAKFKGREGVVVTPYTETLDYRGNRIILKSVSADYLDRKGAQDN